MRMRQHTTRTLGSAAIATIGLSTTDVHTIGIRHTNAQTFSCKHVSDESGGGGFAIYAGDCNNGNPCVITLPKHLLDDGLTDIAAFAIRRRQVHTQSRGCVNLNDTAVLFFQWAHDVLDHHIHATYMQTHHRRCVNSARCYFGVYIVGHIGCAAAGRKIRVIA